MNFDPQSTNQSFEAWQAKLVNRLIELAILISFPGLLLNITNMPVKMWLPLSLLFAMLVAARLSKHSTVRLKSVFIVAVLIAVSIFIATNTGFNSGVRLYLIVAVVMSSVLLGRTAGITTFLIGYAINLALAYHSPTLFFPQEVMTGNLYVWLLWSTADYLMCGALILLLVSYVHEGLRSSFKTSAIKGADSEVVHAELLENQQKYHLLANNMHDMIWTLDLDMNLTYISPSVEEVRGYTVQKAMEIGLPGLTDPNMLDAWKKLMKQELKNDKAGINRQVIRRMESVVKHADGRLIDVEQVISFIRDDTNKPVGILGVSRDISGRKSFERAMETVFLNTQNLVGEDYFNELTNNLQNVIEVDAVVMYEFQLPNKAITISINLEGKILPNQTHSLQDSPAKTAFSQNATEYFENMAESHPDSYWQSGLGMQSYMGAPIKNSEGEVIGQIAAMTRSTMRNRTTVRRLITIFAAQAAGEFNRRHEEKEKEAIRHQLLQAQKIESIGQLAGGVAHDFNNLLVVIRGYADIATESYQDQAALENSLVQIRKASERAAELTRQLLSFSRRQLMKLVPLNPNALLHDLGALLERLLPKSIDYEFIPGENVLNIEGDAGQLEQALINLAVNARDAMPDGGELKVTTRNFQTNQNFVQLHPWIPPGQYVLITVTDTGQGMDANLQDRVFEPFFTTKADGLGTGLGLSVFIGIIKQHRGHVILQSEPGKGSEFRIYLPGVKVALPDNAARTPETDLKGSETILLVEDEEQVRALAERILVRAGYNVILAEDGEEAIEKFKANSDIIDLVFLDVVLPKLSGHQVKTQIDSEYPGMPILLTSGYSADQVHTDFILADGLDLLQKPYTSTQLKAKIRKILSA